MTEPYDHDTRADLLVAEAELGIETEEFFHTNLGQYLMKRIANEIQEAKDEFAYVDVSDTKSVWALQERIKRAQTMQGWIAEVIQRGREAEKILEEENND